MTTELSSMRLPVNVVSCGVAVLRVPISQPVQTAFGTMIDRPAVVVTLTNAEGISGYGEVWCNFPSCGAEHRARLLVTEIAPLILNQPFDNPPAAFEWMCSKLSLLVNQTGEHGPLAQAMAGVDMALWDLSAKQRGKPLYKLLNARSTRIRCYASGINPTTPEQTALAHSKAGYQAFKLKVGFDDDLDFSNALAMREKLGPDAPIMLDANQAWDLPRAQKMTELLSCINPAWMEEPLAVDAPQSQWQQLARSSPIPLAAGENLRGLEAFGQLIESGVCKFIQPDAAKWGGITGCHTVAKAATGAGLCYCPHWLGGGVGLLASAHLLASIGGDGMLEIDGNPNPLRDTLAGPLPVLDRGGWTLPERAGIRLDTTCAAEYSTLELQA